MEGHKKTGKWPVFGYLKELLLSVIIDIPRYTIGVDGSWLIGYFRVNRISQIIIPPPELDWIFFKVSIQDGILRMDRPVFCKPFLNVVISVCRSPNRKAFRVVAAVMHIRAFPRLASNGCIEKPANPVKI